MSLEPVVVNAIVSCTKEIFKTMVFLEVTDNEPYESNGSQELFDFTGIIGLSGKRTGAIGVHLQKITAQSIASGMLGQEVESDSQEVKDAVAEFTNMIAGSMKNYLQGTEIDFDISLPTVVAGESHEAEIANDDPRVSIPFETEKGKFSVEISLKGDE